MEICQEAGQKITTFYYGKMVRRLFRLFASSIAALIEGKYSGKRGLDRSILLVRLMVEVEMETLLNIVAAILFFIVRLADRWG